MQINGMEISDIKDAQDVLSAIFVLNAELENISSNLNNINNKLNNNFLPQFEKHSITFNNAKDDNKEIVNAIINLQKRTIDLKNDLDLSMQNFNNLSIKNIKHTKEEFLQLQENIKNFVNDYFLNLNYTEFFNTLDSDLKERISNLKNVINRLNVYNQKIEDINTKINEEIEKTSTALLKKVNNFDQNSKNILKTKEDELTNELTKITKLTNFINLKIYALSIIFTLGIGFFCGFIVWSKTGANMLETSFANKQQQVINDYYMAQKNFYEKKIGDANLINNFIIKHNLQIAVGTNSKKGNYIAIPISNIAETYKNNKNFIILIK